MTLGIVYESVARWLGHATEVSASLRNFAPVQAGPDGAAIAADVPDVAAVVAGFPGGVVATFSLAGYGRPDPVNGATLVGTGGVLRVDMAGSRLEMAPAGAAAFDEVAIPDEERWTWRVEADFVDADPGRDARPAERLRDRRPVHAVHRRRPRGRRHRAARGPVMARPAGGPRSRACRPRRPAARRVRRRASPAGPTPPIVSPPAWTPSPDPDGPGHGTAPSATAACLAAPTARRPSLPRPRPARVDLELVADGLESPLFAGNAGDGSGRLFVLEQAGRVRVVRDGRLCARRSSTSPAASPRAASGASSGSRSPRPSRPTAASSSTTRTATATRWSASSAPRTRRPTARTRVPSGSSSGSTSRSRTTTAAPWRSDPTGSSGSRPATAARAATRSATARASHAPGQAPAHRPAPGGRRALRDPGGQPVRGSGRRAGRDLGLRPAQPVALLVRPGDRRPLDRRRRPGRDRGGRPLAGRLAGRAELRLEHDGGERLLRPGGGVRPRGAGPAGRRVRPRPGLLDHRRLRLPRSRRPRAGWHVPLRRLLRRDDLGPRSRCREAGAAGAPRVRALGRLVRRGRGRRALRRRPRRRPPLPGRRGAADVGPAGSAAGRRRCPATATRSGRRR